MAATASDLKISVEEPGGWARRLHITVPAERIQRERKDVAVRLSEGVKLPGFRKGKVPTRIMEQRFGATIERETVERALDRAFREAVVQKGFEPLGEASVDNIDYSPGSELSFDVEFEIRPEISLERTGGFRVERSKPDVGDAEIDRVLNRLREQNADWQPLEDARPENEDRVRIRMQALDEDEAGSEPREYQVTLGGDEALDDVEDAIRTLRPGQSGEFVIQLPESDSAEDEDRVVADDHRVRIELLEAERAELPAADDNFAEALDFESFDALRAAIREDLEREAERESESNLRRDLIDQVVAANTFDIPEIMIRGYVDRLLQSQGVESRGDDEETEQVREAARPVAEHAIRRTLVLEWIANEQGLRATEEEVGERIAAIAERTGQPAGRIRAELKKADRLDALENEITEDKVFEFLKSESTIK